MVPLWRRTSFVVMTPQIDIASPSIANLWRCNATSVPAGTACQTAPKRRFGQFLERWCSRWTRQVRAHYLNAVRHATSNDISRQVAPCTHRFLLDPDVVKV